MIQKNIKTKDHGFTIVELLVVIVVIGILAAITLVSYNGITARSNTAGGQSAANNVIQKANAYIIDASAATTWPVTLAALTGAASTTTYYLSGVTYNALGSVPSPAAPSYVQYQLCGYKTVTGTATATTTYAEIAAAPGSTGGFATGVRVGYWDYTAGSITYLSAGTVSGGTPAINCASSGS